MTSTTAPRPRPERPPDAGFTLVEVMISVALFGLIALAGFTLLDSELAVRARTDGRLERLGALQRAMYVMTADFEQMSGAPVTVAGDAVDFRRYAGASDTGVVQVRYDLQDGTLRRTLGGGVQRLVTGVSTLHWSFYVEGQGWRDGWPQPDAGIPRPTAAAVDITLKGAPGEGGVLRRVVALPAQP